MITKSEVKYIQSLGHKKFRDELNLFVAEGPKVVIELLNSPLLSIKSLYATPRWWQQHASLEARLPPEAAFEIGQADLQRISFLPAPNQVLGIFHQPEWPPVNPGGRVSLVLDGLQDPGNLGTILRVADWFGVTDIIASPESADVFNPKVVQSTMGSLGRVRVYYEELSAFLSRHPGIPGYATTLHGQPLASVGKIDEGLVFIGNESRGLSEALLQAADYHITIPGAGKAESLNAGVAAGIVLSWLLR